MFSLRFHFYVLAASGLNLFCALAFGGSHVLASLSPSFVGPEFVAAAHARASEADPSGSKTLTIALSLRRALRPGNDSPWGGGPKGGRLVWLAF
jgi:hypothetical protein